MYVSKLQFNNLIFINENVMFYLIFFCFFRFLYEKIVFFFSCGALVRCVTLGDGDDDLKMFHLIIGE